jgi:ribosomal protein S18 acetylase RimI-like enzyme
MRVTVRSAGIDEAHAVLSIMQVEFEEYRGRLDPPSGALGETIDDVRAAISSGGAFLAFSSDIAVGSARFRLSPGYVYAGRVAVLPAYRGKGVAGALMAAIEASARAHGVAEVRVGVRGSLPANRRLYEKLGYRVLSSRPYETGTDVDITLSKELESSGRVDPGLPRTTSW